MFVTPIDAETFAAIGGQTVSINRGFQINMRTNTPNTSATKQTKENVQSATKTTHNKKEQSKK